MNKPVLSTESDFPKTAVIIINWNGYHYLPACLDSLSKTNYPDKKWQIILIDNNSTDHSLEWIRRHHPEIKTIRNRQNLGFAKANNQGADWVFKQGFDYIVFLNYDTTVDYAWLKQLVKQAGNDKQIGAVQSKIFLFDKQAKINTSGNRLQYLGFGYCGDYGKNEKDTSIQSETIAYPSGAAMLVKKEVWEKVGCFDEDLFMYHEDLDLGWRIWLAGYKIVNAPSSRVYHKYGFSRNPKKLLYMERNRHIVLQKNYSLKTLFLLLPAIMLMEIGMLGYALINGWFIYKIKSYIGILRELPRTLVKRKKIQKTRKITDRDFTQLLCTNIVFEEINNPVLNWIVNPLLWLYWKIISLII